MEYLVIITICSLMVGFGLGILVASYLTISQESQVASIADVAEYCFSELISEIEEMSYQNKTNMSIVMANIMDAKKMIKEASKDQNSDSARIKQRLTNEKKRDKKALKAISKKK